MRTKSSLLRLCLASLLWVGGCAWVASEDMDEKPIDIRPRVAILPIAIKPHITSLSTIRTVDGELSREEEQTQLAAALQEVELDARYLLRSRLASRQVFKFVSSEEADAMMSQVGLPPGSYPTPEQVVHLGQEVGANVLIYATIEDYGKVKWQWLLAGMLTDMTVDNFIIGLATAWNPVALSASVGWDVLTSAPIWFGGGYLFGVAFRPVRVEARAYETRHGYPIWQDMEVAMYAWKELRDLSEEDRGKKQYHLWFNLHHAMDSLAASLAATQKSVDSSP